MQMGEIRQPGGQVFMVNEPKWVRHVLVEDSSAFPKHELMHNLLEPLLGVSIFTTNGEVWERQRRLVDQAFTSAKIQTVFPEMQLAVAAMLHRLDKVADGQSQEIDGEMTYVTADVMFRAILSEPLTAIDAKKIYESFLVFQKYAQRASLLMMYRLWAWPMRFACKRPARRIRQILAKIINECAPDGELSFAAVRKLKLVSNVFRESLRLYPPVGFFVRTSAQDTTMRDKKIPSGSSVLISPWLIHRHRTLWDRSDEFDPDRFDTIEGKESSKCAYIPFSAGPRVCVGKAFATQEAHLILASIVQRYRIDPVLDHEPKPVGRVTVRSDNGIHVRLTRRF
jgi:cytochrome P450